MKVLAVLIGNQEGGNAAEEFIADHIATASQGPEDGILPPPDPQRLSPNPRLSDQSHTRVDNIEKDVPRVVGVGRERWMEDWAEIDLKELLADFDDDEDLTDRHWKRGSEEPHDPTASNTGNQDRNDKLDRVSEQRRPFYTGAGSHYLTALQMANRARRAMPAKSFMFPDLFHKPPHPQSQNFTFSQQPLRPAREDQRGWSAFPTVPEKGRITSPAHRTRSKPITTARERVVTNGVGGRTSRSMGYQHELSANFTITPRARRETSQGGRRTIRQPL